MKKTFFLLILISSTLCFSQNLTKKIDAKILNKPWEAQWITEITGKYSPSFQGVVLFRKTFDLGDVPHDFIIHVSADNRYQLYVNGQHIGNGPARSDVDHWIFETYNIANYLNSGKNIISAKVWNYGDLKPWGQQTIKTGFILQGNTKTEALVNSNYTWKVIRDKAYRFESHDKSFFPRTTGVGPCEKFYADKHPWGWKDIQFDENGWLPASEIGNGLPSLVNPQKYLWSLVPRTIPALTHQPERYNKILRSTGIKATDGFLKGTEDLTIPANSSIELIIDLNDYTTAYPEVKYSNGKGSEVQLIYNEALYNKNNEKVERYKTEGLKLIGYYDYFYPDGKSNKIYQPLWFRTYRFIQLNIKTKEEPLVIHDLKGYKCTFPFELKASFKSNDEYLEKIFIAGWKTGLYSAHECYEDCPYYEQLQYFGDLNISNPITMLLSGNSDLIKNAIMQGEYSRKSGDLTTCSFPTNEAGKIIPYFAIAWIGMINNYWQYEGDTTFVKQFIPAINSIIDWYDAQMNEDNMLGPMPHWNFVDCTPRWPWAPEKGSICEPDGTYTGYSSILTLQYVYGLQLTAKLLKELGETKTANKYHERAEEIISSIYELCWNTQKQYLADTPDKDSYSQHANTMAVLVGMFEKESAVDMIPHIYNDSSLLQMSLQFQAYLHHCLFQYDMADEYLKYLETWKQIIDWGFITFPEYPELNNRSDCHPWNAYPAYELLTIVCGIQIAEPGFGKVKIEPHLGDLKWVEGIMPHHNGEISVKLQKVENSLKGEVSLPDGLDGTFVWQGKEIIMKPGLNTINL